MRASKHDSKKLAWNWANEVPDTNYKSLWKRSINNFFIKLSAASYLYFLSIIRIDSRCFSPFQPIAPWSVMGSFIITETILMRNVITKQLNKNIWSNNFLKNGWPKSNSRHMFLFEETWCYQINTWNYIFPRKINKLTQN